ncbi:uncharacterized protein B0I36DRAFT_348837 [Microdochium trichocladiopsis]|uniref:LysM domain-containing protein n=1 Tax=Microdochium trichocladiopsis TaxID=1682393 RepID=A0A9P9BMW1_9PEZI|nr:uncharacterized protein B0I36DRAFT_348837 [Microdochium trichocladiopsis]KAH7030631.1 hypothetical protein B0I36DRAFT_348837 [Microdochium trichocladiopsis]
MHPVKFPPFSVLAGITALLAARAVEAVPPQHPRATAAPSKDLSLLADQPNFPFDPSTSAKCTWWVDNDGWISCTEMLSEWGISLQDFRSWNPSITAQCGNYVVGRSYCVEAPITSTSTSSTSTTRSTSTSTTKSTSTSPTNGIQTPQPTQPYMVGDCDQFYLVKAGDTCATIGAAYGIGTTRLISWQPSIGTSCQSLWANAYVCVHTIGFQPPTFNSCSSLATDKTWGGNKDAALSAAAQWCNTGGGGSGAYGLAAAKTGCYNAPLGVNKFEFQISNNFGSPANLSVAKCKELAQYLVNTCERGGSGSQEGWRFW